MRLRGSAIGALDRTYLHSPVTASLWRDVMEAEHLFNANLAYGVMRASLYGHPNTSVDEANKRIPEMYRAALETLQYVKTGGRQADDVDSLVDEWREANAGLLKGEGGSDVRG